MESVAWTISMNALRLLWRDPRSLLLLLAMPAMLTVILGVSLSDVMEGESTRPFDAWLVRAGSAPSGDASADVSIGAARDGRRTPEDKEAAAAPLPPLTGREALALLETALSRVPEETGMRLLAGRPYAEAVAAVQRGEGEAVIAVSDRSWLGSPAGAGAAAWVNLGVRPDAPVAALTAELILRRVVGALNRATLGLSEPPAPEVAVQPAGVRPVGAMSYYAAAMGVMSALRRSIDGEAVFRYCDYVVIHT